ncbi:MAG: glycosyltransferase family 2 protein [Rhodanobacter sp.]|nr:MAG: glycosyltransferase family 2 protein [Rhodanobacter sp.]
MTGRVFFENQRVTLKFEEFCANPGRPSDSTNDIVGSIAADYDCVKLVTLHQNAGKAKALNAGLRAARSEYVVTVDADTVVAADFLHRIVTPIILDHADAVAGNVKVGNRQCLKCALQSLEYTCTLSTSKMLQSRYNAITTLPGVGSAFKKSALLAVGGFTPRTRAEDTDLSFELARSKFRRIYQPLAVVYTEAPITWRSLFRQRVRWIYGNMQCAALHLGQLRSCNAMSLLGLPLFIFDNFLAIPLKFLFIVFPLFLIRDAIFPRLLIFYGACMALDWIAVALIYWHEKERKIEILHVPLKWCIWPIFMMAPYMAALWHFVRRRGIGWNKLERSAQVARKASSLSAHATLDVDDSR